MSVLVNMRLKISLPDGAVDRLVGRTDDGGPVWVADARQAITKWIEDNPSEWPAYITDNPETEVML